MPMHDNEDQRINAKAQSLILHLEGDDLKFSVLALISALMTICDEGGMSRENMIEALTILSESNPKPSVN